MNVAPINVLGYHTAEQFADAVNVMRVTDEVRQDTLIGNLAKAFAYIPVIGTIIGIAKLAFSCFNEETWNQHGDNFMYLFNARTIVETLSLGSLFIIPDIVATALRFNGYFD